MSTIAYKWLGLATNAQMIDTTPRPVERGAVLVASIPNNTRVIIQLPRGNLELFDPRPLVLLYAKKLLQEGKYFICLHLLRKQRIDMNILYDTDSMGFMRNVECMILDTIEFSSSSSNSRSSSGGASSNSSGSLELLSLFISSLENHTNSQDKYALPSGSGSGAGVGDGVTDNGDMGVVDGDGDGNGNGNGNGNTFAKALALSGDKKHVSAVGPVEEVTVCNKVNEVCIAVREILLPLVDRKVRDDADVVLQHVTLASIINPLLLTYAKQTPPLLVDAMAMVRQISRRMISLAQTNSTSTSVDTVAPTVTDQQVISSPLIISSIKYLAFVVQLDSLFSAALGECDFEFAMAVARQGQMDPKVYLPLIQSFQSLCPRDKYPLLHHKTDSDSVSKLQSETEPEYSAEYLYMRTRVFVHLGNDRRLDAVKWGFKCLTNHYKTFLNKKDQQDPILAKIMSMKKNKTKSTTATATNTNTTTTTSPTPSPVVVVLDYVGLGLDIVKLVESIDSAKCEPYYEQTFELCNELNTMVVQNKKILNLILDDKRLLTLPTVMLRKLKISFGNCCVKWNRYDEAVTNYLSAEPAAAVEAIVATRMNNNWELCLCIANRYASQLKLLTESQQSQTYDEQHDYNVNTIAQEIIYEFKENLEINSTDTDSLLFTNTSSAIHIIVIIIILVILVIIVIIRIVLWSW